MTAGMYSSATAEWSTPQWLFDLLHTEFGFHTDVCATPANAKCKRYYTPRRDCTVCGGNGIMSTGSELDGCSFCDGLAQPWSGMCWMNPPYGREIGQWVQKAYDTACMGSATVVCLLPARTDTKWFHDYCRAGNIRFLRGRLKFGEAKDAAPFPSMVVTFNAHLDPGHTMECWDVQFRRPPTQLRHPTR